MLKRYLAIRAVDDQDNVGRMVVVDRQDALGLGGSSGGPGPVIRSLRVKPRRFRVGRRATPTVAKRRRAKRGSRIVIGLSEAATVRFTVQRRLRGRRRGRRCVAPKRAPAGAKRCVRWKRRGVLRREAKAGRNRYRFSGRVRRRALRLGRHRLRAVAVDADGNRSRERRARFRVAR